MGVHINLKRNEVMKKEKEGRHQGKLKETPRLKRLKKTKNLANLRCQRPQIITLRNFLKDSP